MTAPELEWHDVGEFELEERPGVWGILPISVARDADGCFHVRVGLDAAGAQPIPDAAALVAFFAAYSAGHLRDLRDGLNGVAGFEDVWRMAQQRLSPQR